MTNPGNAIGTNGAYGGRTSVNAFNDVLSAFSGPGIVSGWQCVPKSNLTVSIGGAALQRDVAIAQNDIGQRTTANNISTQPVDVTLAAAPTAGQRIDAIVAYVNNPPESNSDEIDNPDACGLITVSSSVTTNPTAPTESMIRDAITADGAAGATAYYVILATINIQTAASVIMQNDITAGQSATVKASIPPKSITGGQIADGTITSSNIDFATLTLVAATTSVTSVGVDETAVIQKLRLPAGKWKVTGQFNGSSAQAQVYIADISLWAGSDIFSNITVCGAGSTMDSISILPIAGQTIGVITVNSPIDIVLTIRAREHSIQVVYPKGCWLIAERIG